MNASGLIVALLAIAGCSSKSEAPREKPVPTPPVVHVPDATPATSAPHGCPPSAYRNGGNEIRPVIEAVFPDCPPAELDEALVCVGRACERPCKVTTVSTLTNGDLSTLTVEVASDAAGHRDYIKRGSSLESFTYDPDGRLASWEPTPLPPHMITRNATGAIVKVSAGERSWTFTYDAGGRVTELVYDGLRMKLSYDAAGREILEQDGGHSSTFTYDDAGRLVHRGTEWDDTLSYDAKGRLVKIESAAVIRSEAFAYDELGRLLTQTSAREPGQAQSVRHFDYCR